MSAESRTGGVLFAQNLERVAAFYAAVLGLGEASRADDHIVLESPGFQLVVHRVTRGGIATGENGQPAARRAAAAFKPVFFVPSLPHLRAVVEAHGGSMEREWAFQGTAVCDAVDPEGNVLQLRAPTDRASDSG